MAPWYPGNRIVRSAIAVDVVGCDRSRRPHVARAQCGGLTEPPVVFLVTCDALDPGFSGSRARNYEQAHAARAEDRSASHERELRTLGRLPDAFDLSRRRAHRAE